MPSSPAAILTRASVLGVFACSVAGCAPATPAATPTVVLSRPASEASASAGAPSLGDASRSPPAAFETYSSGGGSGTFMSVLLVRVEKDTDRRDDKVEARWVMKRVGEIGLGDRSQSEVTLTGGTLTIGAAPDRPKARMLKLE